MDEQDKNIVSFENPVEEPEPVKTVEIEYPRAVIDEPAHAAPVGPAHSKPKEKKEKKYVTKGALIACMILTMILSSLLGAFISGTYFAKNTSDGRTARQDADLSQLDLGDATGSELTVAQIVDKNEDAVVEILMSGTAQNMWGQMQLVQGAGSGVIMTEDGYIATNTHVIQGANKVEVTLHNGESYPARIIGSDPANDIAVIKIEAKGLTTATIGDSSTVDVGDLAVAIGNPLGQLGGTATTGIISALDRTLDVEGTTLTLMQTDAAINGGNSGGGLFNNKGELIGIVESKASAVGVEGLAFALPINNVSPIINDFIKNGGNVQAAEATPAVGVVISDVSEENAQYYGLESAGVFIAQVTGENAMKAGFQQGDRIVSFNGTKINNSNEFITLVRKCKVGDTVTIVVSRNGQEIEIKTVLEELQQQQP
ncbi:MAG: trypsin-like peptidase domain-containing protein [Mogibacterium sp.]|nr:trypsin-like peptidase domain-containing protein [Mogibacterium sp.]